MAPIFYYEFSSPYSYLSAFRIDELIPNAQWQPVLFGALLKEIGKVPWSLKPGPARDAEMAGCVERAEALGLTLTWPRDWPMGTYSVAAARAALLADEQGLQREFARAAFQQGLGLGRDLTDLAVIREAAVEAGADADAIIDGLSRTDIKDRLRETTSAAVARGVTGVPTVDVGDELYWGDDRLADAARAHQVGEVA